MFEISVLEGVPVDAANNIIRHTYGFDAIEENFNDLYEHLNAAQSKVEEIPEFLLTETKYELVCAIADTTIICKCKYIDNGFALLFGYIQTDWAGKERLNIVQRRFFTRQGNEFVFSAEGTRKTTPNAIFEAVFLHKTFYPAVLQALEASWVETTSQESGGILLG